MFFAGGARRRRAEKRREFFPPSLILAGSVVCASAEENESVEKLVENRCLDFEEAEGKGAGGAAMNEAERVETRMACLRRSLSGSEEGRKFMMASNARSADGREFDPLPATRARRRRLNDDVVENDEFPDEAEEARDEVADGAGEG